MRLFFPFRRSRRPPPPTWSSSSPCPPACLSACRPAVALLRHFRLRLPSRPFCAFFLLCFSHCFLLLLLCRRRRRVLYRLRCRICSARPLPTAGDAAASANRSADRKMLLCFELGMEGASFSFPYPRSPPLLLRQTDIFPHQIEPRGRMRSDIVVIVVARFDLGWLRSLKKQQTSSSSMRHRQRRRRRLRGRGRGVDLACSVRRCGGRLDQIYRESRQTDRCLGSGPRTPPPPRAWPTPARRPTVMHVLCSITRAAHIVSRRRRRRRHGQVMRPPPSAGAVVRWLFKDLAAAAAVEEEELGHHWFKHGAAEEEEERDADRTHREIIQPHEHDAAASELCPDRGTPLSERVSE